MRVTVPMAPTVWDQERGPGWTKMGRKVHNFSQILPSLKLTWPLKMDSWNEFPFGEAHFQGQTVSFTECNFKVNFVQSYQLFRRNHLRTRESLQLGTLVHPRFCAWSANLYMARLSWKLRWASTCQRIPVSCCCCQKWGAGCFASHFSQQDGGDSQACWPWRASWPHPTSF